jgi:hypothetical protein
VTSTPPPTRPLPAEIGATQHALHNLLLATLRETQIAGHDEWVVLNVAETSDGDAGLARAAQALHRPDDLDAVRTIRADLTASGLLDKDGALTPSGSEALKDGRALVAAAIGRLTEGIEPADLAITATVLTTMRERVESRPSA